MVTAVAVEEDQHDLMVGPLGTQMMEETVEMVAMRIHANHVAVMDKVETLTEITIGTEDTQYQQQYTRGTTLLA
jgi:hypothetical protein